MKTKSSLILAGLLGLAKLSLAGYCASCDPKNPEYFEDTESIAECVFEEKGGGKKNKPTNWEITLPNDHIWSGSKDGKALEARITPKAGCKPLSFTAAPIDEMGTVDVSFMTGSSCGKRDIEKALWKTMKEAVTVSCKKMRS